MNRLIGFTLSFFLVYMIGSIMIAGQSFFIPILIALIIAYFIIALAEWIKKFTHLPMGFSYFSAIMGIILFIYGVSTIVTNNVQSLIELAPVYQKKLELTIDTIFEKFHLPEPHFKDYFGELDLASVVSNLALTVKDVASSAGIISLYVIFMMIEYHYLHDKLVALFKTDKGVKSAEEMVSKVAKKTKSYLRLKTLLSMITASISYIIMVAVGVDFAEFWALLIFLLNYIPTIGSIVATVFPCLLTILQFETLWPFVFITIALILIQFVIGNLVEPRLMGKQLNLSGLVILLSLTIGGTIWGVTGMFICVPILMIISIVLANFESTRPVAVLLSQDGNLEE